MMNAYRRPVTSTIAGRLSKKPDRLIVVTGMRQTGKTTIVLQALKQIDRPHGYLAADNPCVSEAFSEGRRDAVGTQDGKTPSLLEKKDAGWMKRKWKEARIEAERSERGFVIVFDEVQKIPGWMKIARNLWDEDRRNGCPLHVVLIGPFSPLKEKDLSECLAGRHEVFRITYWSFGEMSEAFGFDLPGYVYFGGYPGAASMIHEQDIWRNYIYDSFIQPKLELGIFETRRVRKPALLKKLFETAMWHSGQVLSYNKMLGWLPGAGNTTTLKRYLELLEDNGMIVGLSKYIGTARRHRASSPKLNVLNTALMSARSGYTFEEAKADRSFWKQLVKSAVGAHLFNTGMPEVRLYYWKDGNHQVDFVLELDGKLAVFEVGTSSADFPRLTGMKEFEKRFNPVSCEMVGETGMPLEEFLSVPASDWF